MIVAITNTYFYINYTYF